MKEQAGPHHTVRKQYETSRRKATESKPPKLLAVSKQLLVERFTHDETGATAAVGFLQQSNPPGGCVYRLDYYTDKYGDVIPRSTKVGEM